MKLTPEKPALFSMKGEDLSISSEDLQELMKDVLAKGANFHFRARGWSMTPFIRDGDVITIAPLSQEKLGLGKVVAFIHPASGQLAVHRVIGRDVSAFMIQGDNTASQPDGLVHPRDVLGCVTRVERNGHRIFLGLGLERYLVAALSRNGWLDSILMQLRVLKKYFP